MEKKFELAKETRRNHLGTTLYRIRALRDFSDVKKGDLGGYVESEDNLSQEGDCWIYNNAVVYGDSEHSSVLDNCKVRNNAIVSATLRGNAEVYDYAYVCRGNNSKPSSRIVLTNNTKVYGNAVILDSVKVHGNAEVYGNAIILDNVTVCDNAKVFENARVCGNCTIRDDAKAHGNIKLYDNVLVRNDADAYGDAIIAGNTIYGKEKEE